MVKKELLKKLYMVHLIYVAEKTGEEPLEVFEKAMNNIMPVLEVKARRIGGATIKFQ